MSRLSMRRAVTATLLSTTLIAPTAVTASAHAAAGPTASARRICTVDHAFVKNTKRGNAVWMPTSNHFHSPSNPSGWHQGGGQQGWSESDGSQTAKTKGSADTAEAGGGVNFGIANVSAKYNHQWNRSSTTGNSQTKTWTESVNLPEKTSRMRIYQAGWKFLFTYVVVYEGGPTCDNKTYTRTAVLPTKKKVTAMMVELYANRGKTRPRG